MKKLLLIISLLGASLPILGHSQKLSDSPCKDLVQTYFLATDEYVNSQDTAAITQCFKNSPSLEYLDENGKKQDETKLIKSVKAGNYGEVQKSLQRGASINARDSSGNTSLMYAAMFGTPQTIKLLLKHQPNLNEERNEITPFPRDRKITAIDMAHERKRSHPNAEFNEAEYIITQLKAAGATERCSDLGIIEDFQRATGLKDIPCRK